MTVVKIKSGIEHYSTYSVGIVTRIIDNTTIEVTFSDRTEVFGMEEVDVVYIDWSVYIS